MGGGGLGLFSKPKVTSSTDGHFLGGRLGLSHKVTKSDGGEGGLAYLVSQKWLQVHPRFSQIFDVVKPLFKRNSI